MNIYELTGVKDMDILLLSELEDYDLVQACQSSLIQFIVFYK